MNPRCVLGSLNRGDRSATADILTELSWKAERKGVWLADYLSAMIALRDESAIDRRLEEQRQADARCPW